MKKALSLFMVMFMLCMTVSAQIFTHIKHVDRFDDPVKIMQKRTIVTVTDSTVVFETKGEKPKVFYNYFAKDEKAAAVKQYGTKSKPVNLVSKIFGCQTDYFYLDVNPAEVFHELSNKEFIRSHLVKISHRVVMIRFSGEYKDEYWWYDDGEGGRYIYEKE